jgi:hypothetical protein
MNFLDTLDWLRRASVVFGGTSSVYVHLSEHGNVWTLGNGIAQWGSGGDIDMACLRARDTMAARLKQHREEPNKLVESIDALLDELPESQ